MKQVYYKIQILLVILLSNICVAQTVNTGQMSVSPNTIFSTLYDFDNTETATFINDGDAYMFRNFNNNGTVDFTNGEQGTTHFEGNTIQQLTGNNISYFYNVIFNNASSTTASFELSSEISIDNEANFTMGIVKNDDFGGLMRFEDNGSSINVSNNSHVDGIVEKKGNVAFTYPIGDAQYYRFSAISAPLTTNDVYASKYFYENPDTNYPLENRPASIEEIDNTEYWTINQVLGSGEVAVTLSWHEDTTPCIINFRY